MRGKAFYKQITYSFRLKVRAVNNSHLYTHNVAYSGDMFRLEKGRRQAAPPPPRTHVLIV